MISFETHPERYNHWKLSFDGAIATLALDVAEDKGIAPGYKLKLNSFDPGVDIELHDAVNRVRFEHPEIKSVVVTSGKSRMFCSGANIYMLGTSTHADKVNFCKFTNETRNGIEDSSKYSGLKFLAALNGACAGGGYELALACDEIAMVDDRSSAVSLPETPLLGVLPGTGGLTRLVDKRKVRRDRADVFCTLAEGIKGRRALEWGLIDRLAPRSRFDEFVLARAREWAAREPGARPPGIALGPVEPEVAGDEVRFRNVRISFDRKLRVGTLVVRGPDAPQPEDAAGIRAAGADFWPLRAFRELDRALLHLRFNEPEIGVLLVKTEGDLEAVRRVDATLARLADDWLAREVRHAMKRALKRLDHTARTVMALVEPGSCCAGSLLELALAADRSYMLDDDRVRVALSALNRDAFPMGSGLSRLQSRFLADPARVERILGHDAPFSAREAEEAGLVTFAIDDVDYEDDVRVAIEERASLSPDALTGMEASLRFAGPA